MLDSCTLWRRKNLLSYKTDSGWLGRYHLFVLVTVAVLANDDLEDASPCTDLPHLIALPQPV